MLAPASSSTRAAASALRHSRAVVAAAPALAPAARRYASGGGSSYNQPTGYLFGEKPPPKGQKRQKEDWENIWTYGMFGGMAFALIVLMYRPDTTIQTAVMGEAKKRLAESGEVWQYKPSVNSSYAEQGIPEK